MIKKLIILILILFTAFIYKSYAEEIDSVNIENKYIESNDSVINHKTPLILGNSNIANGIEEIPKSRSYTIKILKNNEIIIQTNNVEYNILGRKK